MQDIFIIVFKYFNFTKIYYTAICIIINEQFNNYLLVDKFITKNPLEQFEIKELISLYFFVINNVSLSLTNLSLYLLLSTILLIVINFIKLNNNKVIADKWVIIQESIYDTVYKIVINQIDKNKGEIYFPIIYILFIFILINNLFGMIPYSFASTSHFILAFSLSFSIVIGATILGLEKHKLKFFSLFVPAGCPLGLLPVLVLIEFISYLARNISLGLRLAANVLSGHMLLSILSGFTYNLMTSKFLYIIISLLPLTFVIAFSGLELAIAFIQSQVFIVLSCSYIKDAIYLH